ncbi:MAG: hypothetical protein ACRCUT_06520 [Spirochaetota bacterium]
MHANKIIWGFLLTLSISTAATDLFALSAAVKSQNDYAGTLEMIRDLRVIVENFGTDAQKKKYEDIRIYFKQSAERHYAGEFIKPDALTEDAQPDNNAQSSVEMFNRLKLQMSELFDEIANGYIIRAQMLLDSTSKETNDILIDYGKNTGSAKYFYRPIDPLTEKKPYNPGKYHFYRDKETLERYLKSGYKALQDARTLYNNPDYMYIKAKKNKTSGDLDFLLSSQQGVIKYCRQAKQYGIEIHRILKETSLVAIQKKYNVSLGTIVRSPLYDDRIPEEFKVDAIDNQKQIFSLEKETIGYTASSGSAPQEQKK